MAEAILLTAWLVYCIMNVVQIFKKAKEEGDTATAHTYARRKLVNIGLATVLFTILTIVVYVL